MNAQDAADAEYLTSTGKTFDEVLDRTIDRAEDAINGQGFIMILPKPQVWAGIENDVLGLERLIL